jgi:hypothetical protein
VRDPEKNELGLPFAQGARLKEPHMQRQVILPLFLAASLVGTASAEKVTHDIHPNAACTPMPGTSSCRSTQLPPGTGPMINNVKLFLVFYSPGYQYKDQLVSFYQAIVQSPYMDMLQEYDKTSYKIRRGSYAGVFEDTNANPSSVTSVDPQTYITGLISAGKVPKPDANTLYMIYFPNNIDPSGPGGGSCISGGQFCAYHSNTTSGGAPVYYGVMPDTNAGHCAGGCGPSGFDGITDVSGHEFVEALTDPTPNKSWTDNACGEIGDVCATIAQDECIQEWDVVSGFKVQKEWSNSLKDCVVANPKYTLSDFSMSMPANVNVPQGGMATVDLTLTKIGTMADTVALTATGAATGVVVSFAPASITSDAGKSTITIQASSTAALGAGKFTVNAKGMSGSMHTEDVSYTVVSPPDMAMGPDLATPGNGGNGGGNGGNGNGGGSGNHGGDSGCSMAGSGQAASPFVIFALFALALVLRSRRRA